MRGSNSRSYQPSVNSDMNEDEGSTQGEQQYDEKGSSNQYSAVFTLILFLISFLFLGLLIYALFKYNTDAVRDACPNLLLFINIRTVIGLIFFASLYTYISCVHHGKSDHGEEHTHSYNPLIITSFFSLYFLIFCVAGALLVPKSMIGNSVCVDILHDSIFKAPLLGILGWIYIVFDGVFSIFFFFVLFSMTCRSNTKETDGSDMPMMGEEDA